jgi:hypothetical protein
MQQPQMYPDLGVKPAKVPFSPFSALAFVQGWCHFCQDFHPRFKQAQKLVNTLSRERGLVRLPPNFVFEAVESTPPPSVGSGVPALLLLFNGQQVPLRSRFWVADPYLLALTLAALYGPFYNRWVKNHELQRLRRPSLGYDDLVEFFSRKVDSGSHPGLDPQLVTMYQEFLHELPSFLESV